jgi:CBS-domain-containing membrane protein
MQTLTVASVMTTDPFTVAPDTEFKTIVDLLTEKAISAVPVVDSDGVAIGVVSETDLLCKEEYLGDAHRWLAGRQTRSRMHKSAAIRAADLMTSPVLAVSPTESLIFAARELTRRGVRRLFVLDHGKLVGVVSRRDLLRVFLRSDKDIRQEIQYAVFQKALSVDPQSINVTVQRGVATMLGRLERRSEVEIAGRLAPGIPGVVEVRNRLDYAWNDLPEREDG